MTDAAPLRLAARLLELYQAIADDHRPDPDTGRCPICGEERCEERSLALGQLRARRGVSAVSKYAMHPTFDEQLGEISDELRQRGRRDHADMVDAARAHIREASRRHTEDIENALAELEIVRDAIVAAIAVVVDVSRQVAFEEQERVVDGGA